MWAQRQTPAFAGVTPFGSDARGYGRTPAATQINTAATSFQRSCALSSHHARARHGHPIPTSATGRTYSRCRGCKKASRTSTPRMHVLATEKATARHRQQHQSTPPQRPCPLLRMQKRIPNQHATDARWSNRKSIRGYTLWQRQHPFRDRFASLPHLTADCRWPIKGN